MFLASFETDEGARCESNLDAHALKTLRLTFSRALESSGRARVLVNDVDAL